MKQKQHQKHRNAGRLLSVFTAAALFATSISVPCNTRESQAVSSMAETTLSNPTTDSDGVTTWDCIYFGNYWQNDTNGDGTADQNDTKEPIKWRVLSVDGDDVFLLADQNLDSQSYNEEEENVTWETCTLRTWLNGTFLTNAFSTAEQEAIKSTTVVNDDNPTYDTEGGNNTTDKVYLLSIAEAGNTAYGFNGECQADSETRVAKNTAYVASYDTMYSVGEADNWWLRSPGSSSNSAAFVDYNGWGYDYGYGVDGGDVAVRPALHVNLSSSTLWSYAGKVTSNGGGDMSQTTATPTPADPETPTDTTPAAPTATVSATPLPTDPTAVPTIVPTASTITQSSSQPKQSTAPTVTPTLTPTSAPTSTADAAMETSDIPSVQLKSLKALKKGKAKVTWKKTDEISGYRLQYAQDKKFKKKAKTKLLAAKKTSVTLTGLKKKKTYYVRICAYSLADGEKVYGKWSNVKKVKIKK